MENIAVEPLPSARPVFRAPAEPKTVHPGDLLRLPLFEGVEPGLVKTLAEQSSRRHFAPRSILMRQGDAVDRLQMLVRGFVELTTCGETQSSGVLLLSARDLIMPAAAVFGEPTLVTVRALTTVNILEIGAPAIRSAIEHSPQFALNMMKAMSGQWRMAVRNIIDLNSRTAAERFAAFLLRIADAQQGEGTFPTLPMSKRCLASRLGITPETLSRILQIVADNGLHLRGRSIIVLDRAKVEKFCGPDPYPKRDERMLRVYAF
jgi:CRP/FNR family transcriptional activator FtrB